VKPLAARLSFAVLALSPAWAAAAPDLGAARTIAGLTVYPDDRNRALFFYGPGEIAMVEDAHGKPDFHFLQMRYTGTAATADRGTVLHRSVLTFRVALAAPGRARLDAARQALATAGRPPELRPLPIRRLEAGLVYASVTAAEGATLPAGHFERSEAEPTARPDAFWATRSYTLSLDPHASELFGSALANGQTLMSMSYAFFALGRPAVRVELAGPAQAVGELERTLQARRAADAARGSAGAREQVVRAGALAITVDVKRWPELVRRVDVNDRVPPGYPLLDVYCYDFGGESPAALYEKQVEVEAEGAGGGRVRAGTRFGRDQPDLYARRLRFGVAVRLDRPYRYRLTEVTIDGGSAVTPWRERRSWSEVLDVTGTGTPEGAPRETSPGGGVRP
jgi:hypothetical protein